MKFSQEQINDTILKESLLNIMIDKDFYKLDVYRFDIEYVLDDWYNVNVSNSISWDYFTIKVNKSELKGLADFITRMVNTNDQT